MVCPHCGHSVDPKQMNCPNCHAQVKVFSLDYKDARSYSVISIVLAMVSFFAFGIISYPAFCSALYGLYKAIKAYREGNRLIGVFILNIIAILISGYSAYLMTMYYINL